MLSVIEETPVSVSTSSPDGRLLYLNRAGRQLLGIGQDERLDTIRTLDTYAPWTVELFIQEALPIAARDGQWEGETAVITRGGREVQLIQSIVAHRDDTGAVLYYSTVVKDITKRKEMEDELRYEATHDALTGAMNRRRFEQRLQKELALAARSGEEGAVIFLDLDEFKEINDTFGHHAGDVVLQNIVHVLRRHLRETDTFARIGGDEFAIVLPRTPRGKAEHIVERLLAAVADEAVSIGGRAVRVQGSMGIAMYPADATTVEGLLIEADRAMYASKGEGGRRLSG